MKYVPVGTAAESGPCELREGQERAVRMVLGGGDQEGQLESVQREGSATQKGGIGGTLGRQRRAAGRGFLLGA